MTDKCEHKLSINVSTLLKDGRNPMVVYCIKCDRSWNCDSINFAPMGQPPRWTIAED